MANARGTEKNFSTLEKTALPRIFDTGFSVRIVNAFEIAKRWTEPLHLSRTIDWLPSRLYCVLSGNSSSMSIA